jgi:serine/threonine-protein kinase
MAAASTYSLVDALRQHRLLEPAQLAQVTGTLQARFAEPKALAGELLRRGWLTPYQANQLLQGKSEDLVLGSYMLLERLGEGGMGQVFKARHRNLGRIVALKLIRKERLDNPAMVKRFQREVRAAAALVHPNIMLAYDADEVNGTHILVMEFVEGATDLSQLVKRNGPLPVPQACEYTRQAALGLQHASERGLVHRDIKPSNLLVSGGVVSGGKTAGQAASAHHPPLTTHQIKILDMGLARLDQPAAADDKSSTMTQEGAVMGTPDYIAPEQARDSHQADIRADLYSLGCTLYFLLTGRVPFPGGSLTEKLIKHQLHETVPVEQLRPDVPPAVAAVVRKLMAKKREERFQTPAEVAVALKGGFGTGSQASVGVTIPGRNLAAAGQHVDGSSSDTLASALSYMAQGGGTVPLESPPVRSRSAVKWPWLAGGALGLVSVLVILFLFIKRPGKDKPVPEDEPQAVAVTPSKKPPAKADNAWLNAVAAMPAGKQVEAVAAKLRALNPGFDGRMTHQVKDGVVTELVFETDEVIDLSPLLALPGLLRISCSGSGPGKSRLPDGQFIVWDGTPLGPGRDGVHRLTDLKPLKRMKLTVLDCSYSRVSDLAPLKGMPIAVLTCAHTKVSDLRPLKGMPLAVLYCHDTPIADLRALKDSTLQHLLANYTEIADLKPIKDLKLIALSIDGTPVEDLSPLTGMSTLQSLGIYKTKVSKLSPLAGLKLSRLGCGYTRITDLGPLKGMPLTNLDCIGAPISDLSPLEGTPLKHLDCRNTQVADLKGLGGTSLTTLLCDGTKVSDLAPIKNLKLTELSCGGTKVADLSPVTGMPLTHLNFYGTRVTDLGPLRGMGIIQLNCYENRVTDLSPLKGMPLTGLNCQATQVSDLSPLKGMQLAFLRCQGTLVADLSPLKGMPLTTLYCSDTPVRDLSSLKGMPLTTLGCEHTKVTDLSPLKGMPLKDLRCDFVPKRDAEILRSIKTLERINGKPVKQFWKEVEGKK